MKIDPAEFFDLVKSPTPGRCRVKFCTRDSAQKSGGFCPKHKMQLWRARHPRAAAFASCKWKAKQRGIPWEISMADFRALCDATSYHDARGRDRFALSLDRIDATGPYSVGNVQVITIGENVAKANRERHLPEHVRQMMDRPSPRWRAKEHEPECPF